MQLEPQKEIELLGYLQQRWVQAASLDGSPSTCMVLNINVLLDPIATTEPVIRHHEQIIRELQGYITNALQLQMLPPEHPDYRSPRQGSFATSLPLAFEEDLRQIGMKTMSYQLFFENSDAMRVQKSATERLQELGVSPSSQTTNPVARPASDQLSGPGES